MKDWVILELIKPEMQGIIIPEDLEDPLKQPEMNAFKVIELGPDCKFLQVGDMIAPYYNPILFHKDGRDQIWHAKEEFVALYTR